MCNLRMPVPLRSRFGPLPKTRAHKVTTDSEDKFNTAPVCWIVTSAQMCQNKTWAGNLGPPGLVVFGCDPDPACPERDWAEDEKSHHA